MFLNINFNSLASRIISLVLIILICFSIGIGFVTYNSMRTRLRSITMENLSTLATAKEQAVEIMLQRFEEVVTGFALPDLSSQVEDYLDAAGDMKEQLRRDITISMRRSMQASLRIVAAQVVDRSNNILIQTDPELPLLLKTGSVQFKSALLKTTIGTPFFLNEEFLVDMTTPLQDSGHNMFAVLIVRKQATLLMDITGDYEGLGETGETVIGQARQDSVYFIAPIRGDPGLRIVQPAPLSGTRARPMINATRGQSGIVPHVYDYAENIVFAAYRPIRSPSISAWGLVLKIHEGEALAPANNLRGTLVVALVILLLIAAAIVVPLAGSFVKPLKDLEEATERVADGALDVRVPVRTKDEIGRLSNSFNKMTSQLGRARDDLMRSNQELSSFAYVVSHDLKAPLRGISSLTTWLSEDLADQLEGDQLIQMELLRNRVGRMNALIDGLLEYSRIGRVKAPAVMTRVEDLVIRVIDLLDPPDDIEITVEAPLPVIMVDDLRLSQVFQNLIGNAISYHPGPEGVILIGCRDAGDFWEFFVSDDGDGIEPRFHDRIFAMFQSLQPQDDVDSTGVGLALVKKIVEDRSGDIWVESEGVKGKGATFRFTWLKNMIEA